VLNSIRPYSFWTISGDRIVGFKLDQALARKANIKKSIDIKITGGVKQQKENLTVENLMLSGLKLQDFTEKALTKQYFKIKIKLKKFKGKAAVKRILYFNPKTNEFIE